MAAPLTIDEIIAQMGLVPPAALTVPPSAQQTLRSYVQTFGAGLTIDLMMSLLCLYPALAENFDAVLHPMPMIFCSRIAAYLQRPISELVWACKGRVLTAPAVAVGRRFPR